LTELHKDDTSLNVIYKSRLQILLFEERKGHLNTRKGCVLPATSTLHSHYTDELATVQANNNSLLRKANKAHQILPHE
jgi:hypothetical protein